MCYKMYLYALHCHYIIIACRINHIATIDIDFQVGVKNINGRQQWSLFSFFKEFSLRSGREFRDVINKGAFFDESLSCEDNGNVKRSSAARIAFCILLPW